MQQYFKGKKKKRLVYVIISFQVTCFESQNKGNLAKINDESQSLHCEASKIFPQFNHFHYSPSKTNFE